MPTAGDLAALLGGARARVKTAHAVIRDWTDPFATLEAMKNGPWADEVANTDDPGMFGLPDEPTTLELRQWVDYEHNRAARGARRAGQHQGRPALVEPASRARPRTSGTEPASSLELCDALLRWTDPQPLTRLMELEPDGRDRGARSQGAAGHRHRARATTRIAGEIAPLGWSADRWELDRRRRARRAARDDRVRRRQAVPQGRGDVNRRLTSRSTTHYSLRLPEFDRATSGHKYTRPQQWPRPAGGAAGEVKDVGRNRSFDRYQHHHR